MLDPRDDELWLLGHDEVPRVDDFVARAGHGLGVAALVLDEIAELTRTMLGVLQDSLANLPAPG